VKIGEQTWMAENLNYAACGSKCYNNQDSYCNTYGRLYNWVTAMALPASCQTTSCASQINAKHRGICPEGWHIPSDAEFDVLINSVGGISTAGRHLKATSGWNSHGNNNGNGLDTYGFTALPGGASTSFYYSVGFLGVWWSSSESDSDRAYNLGMDNSRADVRRTNDGKSSILLSVRCLQD
jgi:uncharacterized protein (TIGR02145 family)